MFIQYSLTEETISEYKLKPTTLITELISFAKTFKDDDDDPSVLERLRHALQAKDMFRDDVESVEKEVERVLKMFYLQMRVKGHLKPFKEDYFV